MALSEIEKLERRYAENPQGLTFAPLAEVHRKSGDVSRALDLLRPGLTLHPDYIPASIVLGRCHVDLGDLQSAEQAFTHVLALDGENVIALKALADITERLFRFDESERWLRTLLAIDRSNDEARDQLGRVETARRQAETGSSASPDAGPPADEGTPGADAPAAVAAEAEAEEVGVGGTSAAAEPMTPVDMPADVGLPPMPEAPRESMFAWVADSGSPGADPAMPLDPEDLAAADVRAGPAPEGIELEQPVTLEREVEPLEGLVGRDLEPRHDDSGSADEGEFAVETAEDIVLESSGGSEYQVADASQELLASRGFHEPDPFLHESRTEIPTDADDMMPFGRAHGEAESIASREPGPAAADTAMFDTSEPPVAEAVPAWHESFSTEPPAPAPEPTATEPEPSGPEPAVAAQEVAPVAAESPPAWAPPLAEPPRAPELDLVLTESMAELLVDQGHPAEALTIYRHLERRDNGGGRFGARIAELERTASTPAPAYSVQETHGQSVQEFFRGVLASRPPAMAPGHSASADPSHSSADQAAAPTRPAHDSLSLSSVFGEESTPTLPAVPAGGGASGDGVSYDDFFGAAGSSAAPRPARESDPKSDDLDQFHAWLQNLKR